MHNFCANKQIWQVRWENRNSPGKSEESIEDVVSVRRKRDVLENEKSGNLPRGQKRRRKKPGKPRKHKGTKKALLQRPSDRAIKCSCRASDIIDEYLKSHPPGVLHVPKVTTFPSIHLVGPEGGIQVKFRQYLTWKHSHELTLTVNNVSENLDLCHQNHMKQEAHEFIVIPQNGMYYVYCQVMYSDGRSPNVGHTTVLKRKGSETVTVLMRSGTTEVDSQSNVCIKRDDGKTRSLSPSDSAYHGGVFHLLEGDRLGVMASAPGECFASSPEQTYFGAFMVSPSVNINIAQTEDASVDDDFFGQALDLLLSPARAFWNIW